MSAVRLIASATLMILLLVGCSGDTGGGEREAVVKAETEERAKEEPGKRTYRELVRLNRELTRLIQEADPVFGGERDPDIASRARSMAARMRRVRAEAPPTPDALLPADLKVGKANEKVAERLADAAEAPTEENFDRYRASDKEWRRVTKEANEGPGIE